MADSKPERFLPEDIVIEILSKLPLKSQLRLRGVSKSWHGIISDPQFPLSIRNPRPRIALQHWTCRPRHLGGWIHDLTLFRFVSGRNRRRSRFDLDNRWCSNEPQLRELASKASILMTFKGLLLLRAGTAIYLLNPMIRRLKKLFTEDSDTKVIGICSDSSTGTDDYKILLLTKYEWPAKDVVRVGSFKTKTLKEVPFPYSPRIYGYDVLFVHERIHLFFNHGRFVNEDLPLLISFDAAKDEFMEVPVPVTKDLRYEKGNRIRGLGVLNGCLALSISPRDSQVADIWILKGSWTILFTLVPKCHSSDKFKPLGFTKDGELLIETGRLMLYNPMNDSYRNALAKPLKGALGSDIVTFNGNVFFPSHLTEFQLSKKTLGKRKRAPS